MTRNIFLFYLKEILTGLKFYEPILILFFVKIIGFDYSSALLLNSIIWGLTVFFEIPTGAIADRFGRKKVI